MPARLVALDEGPDIPLDRAMLVVGRHPQCDARLDSIRVSRRHCCMMQERDSGEVVVRDLGSTNGIRINGQRVEMGKLRVGDELSIAHIRYRLEGDRDEDLTLAETVRASGEHFAASEQADAPPPDQDPALTSSPLRPPSGDDQNPLAAAVRDLLPASVAERCQIQVIVQLPQTSNGSGLMPGADAPPEGSEGGADPSPRSPGSEPDEPCPQDSSR